MELAELINTLIERRNFFLALSKMEPGFTKGFAEGLQEAITALVELIHQAEADPSTEKTDL